MSETTDLATTGAHDAAGPSEAPAASGTAGSPRRRGNGLSGMLLPELQRLATELGISGTGKMRKGDLVAAISERQVGASASGSGPSNERPLKDAPVSGGVAATAAPLEAPISGGADGGPVTEPGQDRPVATERPAVRSRRGASRPAGSPTAESGTAPSEATPEVAPSVSAPTESGSSPSEGEQRTEGDRPQRSRERGGRNRNDRNDRDGGDRTAPDRPAPDRPAPPPHPPRPPRPRPRRQRARSP